ncbi:MAG: acyl-CoA/acyl-ACP dehydrogenase [Gammaproteobacteria bacterium]|nr:acyl-CoA/acyl-ACP dehydrogenase [Gammaproteobacteria bacterium]
MISKHLARVENFLKAEVAPIANELDGDCLQLVKVFGRFKQLGILGLLVPQELGGWGGDHHALVRYSMLLTNYSGALMFLQSRHQYAVMDLLKYVPTEGVKTLFRQIVENREAVGAFLKTKKSTIIEDGNNLRLSLTMPWVSGYGIFDKALISFLYNNDLCYTLIPFKNCETNHGAIQCSERIETIIVDAVNTISVSIDNWFIRKSELLYIIPAEERLPSVPHPTIYNFAGVGQILLKEVEKSRHFNTELVQTRHHVLQQKLDSYIEKIFQPITDPVKLRAQGRRVANACSEFARLVLSSSVLLPHSKVERLCREVWLYSAIPLQPEQLAAYLADS